MARPASCRRRTEGRFRTGCRPGVVWLAVAAMLLAACGMMGEGRHRQSGGETADGPDGGRQARPDPYETALEVRHKSGCLEAIPLLEPLAALGRGHEMAQFQLGQC